MGPELRRFLPGENLLLFLPLRIKDESQRERERERPFQLVRLFYVLERLVVPLLPKLSMAAKLPFKRR